MHRLKFCLIGCFALVCVLDGTLVAQPSTTRIRRNWNQLTPPQKAAFARGVQVMKGRNPNDPTSWQFQANMHGVSGPPTNPLFAQCPHNSPYFLVWHRGYLHFFERILRNASGDPNLNLPYWNWPTDALLPTEFRSPNNMQANALYEPSRNINNGSLLDTTSLQSQLTRANQQSSFFRQSPTRPGFQSLLESPHGNLHVQVGGQMGAVPSSANDPIFWLHHANVDRQWDQWMNSLPGRQLPNDPNFLNQTFRFVDETGSIVTVRAQDILRSDTLGYRYDDVFGVAELVALEGTAVDHQLIATNAISNEAVDASIALPFGETRIPLAFQAGGQELVESIPANTLQNRDGGVFLRVRGIKFKSIPKFVFGVYLNLPEDEKNEQRKLTHFAGTLDLFSATQSHSNPENTEQLARPESDELSFDQNFDLSPIIAQLKQIGEFDATRLEVVILPIAPLAPRAFQEQASADFKASAETANVSFGRIEVLKD